MAASLTTRLLCHFFQWRSKPKWATEASGSAVLARAKGSSQPPRRLAARVTSRQVGGFTVHRVAPSHGIRRRGAVVYLHGGAYVSEIVTQHWSMVSDIADATGRVVDVAIYGLAPQHNALQARAFGLALLEELDAEFGADPRARVDLAGDSAGGGFALLLAQARRDAGLPPARRVVVMAPWLDISNANPAVAAVEPHDPWLSRAGTHPVARAWAGELDRTDPRVSPLFGGAEGLPPVDIFVGTRDITVCDSTDFINLVTACGGEGTLWLSEGSPHVYPLLPTPEGRQGRREFIDLLCH